VYKFVEFFVAGGMCSWSSQTRLCSISGGNFNSHYWP